MPKPEAEKAIRYLSKKWFESVGRPEHPCFSDFREWAVAEGYGNYFTFRSTMGAREDCERWFDQELHQTWRN